MSIRLSKSALDKFTECPRCFWLKYARRFDQPDMISSKVWKGVERVTQAHYDRHRQARTTPENLVGQVPAGAIPYQADRISMKDLRYWGKGLRFAVGGVEVTTALDDMLQREVAGGPGSTCYNVIDFKSKSKPTDEQATADLYQNQADVFDLACNVNGYPTDGNVYFDYWYPIEVVKGIERIGEGYGLTQQHWGSQVIVLRADHARIKSLIVKAAACLESVIPEPTIRTVKGKKVDRTEGCAVCLYVAGYAALFKKDSPAIDAAGGQEVGA